MGSTVDPAVNTLLPQLSAAIFTDVPNPEETASFTIPIIRDRALLEQKLQNNLYPERQKASKAASGSKWMLNDVDHRSNNDSFSGKKKFHSSGIMLTKNVETNHKHKGSASSILRGLISASKLGNALQSENDASFDSTVVNGAGHVNKNIGDNNNSGMSPQSTNISNASINSHMEKDTPAETQHASSAYSGIIVDSKKSQKQESRTFGLKLRSNFTDSSAQSDKKSKFLKFGKSDSFNEQEIKERRGGSAGANHSMRKFFFGSSKKQEFKKSASEKSSSSLGMNYVEERYMNTAMYNISSPTSTSSSTIDVVSQVGRRLLRKGGNNVPEVTTTKTTPLGSEISRSLNDTLNNCIISPFDDEVNNVNISESFIENIVEKKVIEKREKVKFDDNDKVKLIKGGNIADDKIDIQDTDSASIEFEDYNEDYIEYGYYNDDSDMNRKQTMLLPNVSTIKRDTNPTLSCLEDLDSIAKDSSKIFKDSSRFDDESTQSKTEFAKAALV